MFILVQKYYNQNVYTKNDVAEYVSCGIITPEQYKEITGEEYIAR